MALGGHDVEEQKIRERYTKSLANISKLLEICDIMHVYDNTIEPVRIIRKHKEEFSISQLEETIDIIPQKRRTKKRVALAPISYSWEIEPKEKEPNKIQKVSKITYLGANIKSNFNNLIMEKENRIFAKGPPLTDLIDINTLQQNLQKSSSMILNLKRKIPIDEVHEETHFIEGQIKNKRKSVNYEDNHIEL